MADVLFLLSPGFADANAGPGGFYCPPCATVSGLLGYYPYLRAAVEVREVDFPRPRAEVVELLGGPDHSGCPVLVLDDTSTVPDGVKVHVAKTGKRYVDGATDIGTYLAARHGASRPHP